MSKKYVTNSISGIWNSYGCVPKPGESIEFGLEDSGLYDVNSLIDLCKFSTDKVSIGEIANQIEVSELIVMLPMLSTGDTGTSPEEIEDILKVLEQEDLCQECVKMQCDHQQQIVQSTFNTKKSPIYKITYPSIEENSFLFKVKPELVNKILNVDDYKKFSIYEIKKMLEERYLLLNQENTIVKLMNCMVKYYIPPHLNWLLNKEIPPIAFYTVEVKAILTKDDLSNIWQGSMPNMGMNPDEEEIEVEHYFNEEEILGNYNIAEIENIKLSIFKCKKIGSSEYEQLKMDYVEQNNKQWYNYNWPYDNFSLVEFMRVEAGEVRDYVNDGKLTDGVLKLSK